MGVVLDNLDQFLSGMRATVVLTLVSFAIAAVLGLVAAGFRVSPVPPLRVAGASYVNIVRNTPLAVLFILLRERADTLLLLSPSRNDSERLERLADQGLLESVAEGSAGLAVATVRGSAVEAAALERA